jgi:hypothetical protein
LKLFYTYYFLLSILITLLNYSITFSSDTLTTKPKSEIKKDSVLENRFILSDYSLQFINISNPDTLTRKRFLWYPAKTFEDIFSYRKGYYVYFMDIGQLNPINFNQMGISNFAILRNNRLINDYIDGSIDFNLLSRNEIALFEFSNGLGNNTYDFHNSVNIIQKEVFRFKPFTEISFFQDRYENLYFDGNFHQNITRFLNFNFGITKHSYDGHYINSDFDKWQGRFNLTIALSDKVNFFAKFNYAKIKKGLNEGINPDTVNLKDKESVFNRNRAVVFNSDAYEIKERFDYDFGFIGKFLKNSYTKIHFYYSDTYRNYRDEENRTNPNGIYIKNNLRWFIKGIKLSQLFKFNLTRNFIINSKTETEFFKVNQIYDYNFNNLFIQRVDNDFEELNILENLYFDYKGLSLNAYLLIKSLNSDKPKERFGFNINYKINFNKDNFIKIYSIFNNKNKYISGGIFLNYSFIQLNSEFYSFKDEDTSSIQSLYQINSQKNGINTSVNLKFFKFNLFLVHNHTFNNNESIPKNSGIIKLLFEDSAFRDKLEYKIGFISKYWSDFNALFYNSVTNSMKIFYESSSNTLKELKIPANASLDFNISAKIGRAEFGLTLENILDRIIYNTGLYPLTDRGGFLNVISRFNITWNFFD